MYAHGSMIAVDSIGGYIFIVLRSTQYSYELREPSVPLEPNIAHTPGMPLYVSERLSDLTEPVRVVSGYFYAHAMV